MARKDILQCLPDEILFLLLPYLDDVSAFYLTRISGTLNRLYGNKLREVHLRPAAGAGDPAALDRLLAGAPWLRGLSFHGEMTDLLVMKNVQPSYLVRLRLCFPTAESIAWLLWSGMLSLQHLELVHATEGEFMQLVGPITAPPPLLLLQLQSLSLVDMPGLSLDVFEGQTTRIEKLVLDGRVDSPMQTIPSVLRACPRLRSLTLQHCSTAVLDALGCAMEDGLCNALEVLRVDGPRVKGSTLYLMQVVASRLRPEKLRDIHLCGGLRWCLNWPSHLPRVHGVA
jgi:hypothetical protein